MTWKQKLVCRVLLMIARLASEDEWLRGELKSLDAHISVGPMGNEK